MALIKFGWRESDPNCVASSDISILCVIHSLAEIAPTIPLNPENLKLFAARAHIGSAFQIKDLYAMRRF